MVSINPVNNQIKTLGINNSIIIKDSVFKQISLLKKVCDEVCAKLFENKELINLAKEKLNNFDFTDSAIKILISEKDSILLKKQKTDNQDLLTINFLRNNDLISSINVNEKNLTILSFIHAGKNYNNKNLDNKLLQDVIENIYNLVDFPLLKLRLFIKQNFSEKSTLLSENSIVKSENTNESELKKEEIKDFLPPKEQWHNYSFNEIIKQNPKKQKSKGDINRLPIIRKIYQERAAIESAKTTYEKKAKKPREKVKKETRKKQILPAGTIDTELKSKLIEIFNIFSEIKKFLRDKHRGIAANIISSYSELTANGKSSFSFKDLRIFFPEKAYNNEHITSIINLNNVESLNITDSGKISVNKYSSNRNSKKPKLKFLSQEEINSPENQNNIQNSINNALSKLKDFQNYIERQGWRIRKSKEVEDKEIANLDFSTIKKIRTIKKRYENIRQKLSSMSFYEARKLKNKYSPNSPSKTSRIEFSNPLGDGMNYFFDKSLTRYGEIYKIVKYKDKANVEEKFAITADGKVVKNLNPDRSISTLLPTGQRSRLIFYSNEEIVNSNIPEKINFILDILDENMFDYEKFILSH